MSSEIKTVATRVIVEKIKSETNKQVTYYLTTTVSCTCPAGSLKGGPCKHADAKLNQYATLESEEG